MSGAAPSAISGYLVAQDRWLLWRTETVLADAKTGRRRRTKVPISYHTGRKCDVTKAASWADHGHVVTALARTPGAWAGPGFALGVIEALAEIVIGLDLDTCLAELWRPVGAAEIFESGHSFRMNVSSGRQEVLEPAGTLASWAAPFLLALPSYTEVSPSGTGLKTIARLRLADLPEARRLLDIPEGDKEQACTVTFGERADGAEHVPNAQLFLMRRYFAVTGEHWAGSPDDVTLLELEQIAELARLFGPRPAVAARSRTKRSNSAAQGMRDGVDDTGADDDTAPDEAALRDMLGAAFLRNPRLRERWEGGTDGLRDTSRSGRDMSVLAMLVAAGFSEAETYAAMCLFEHGKVAEEPPRYFDMMWDRTVASPPPRPGADWEATHPPVGDAVAPEPPASQAQEGATEAGAPEGTADTEWQSNAASGQRGPEQEPTKPNGDGSSGGPQPPPPEPEPPEPEPDPTPGPGDGPPPDWEQQHPPRGKDPAGATVWPEPVDILAERDTGAPILTEDHVPDALWPFVKDTAERLGVATSSVALCATTTCSAGISEEWCIQPKRHDWDWTERARLWAALIGDPSVLKTPVVRITTAPIERLDRDAGKAWADAMAKWREDMRAWKAVKKNPDPPPEQPRKNRFLVESVTIEALQEVLRDDIAGKMTAPLGKVMCRQDELSGFLAGMDRYGTGGKGGTAEQAAWLQTYNGGRYVVDRILRGSFSAASWSACVIGGIQPEPIQRIATSADHDGMLQRFQFDVPAASGAGIDRAPDRTARDLYHALIPALADLRPALNEHEFPRHVVLDDDAHQARDEITALATTLADMPDTSPQLQSVFRKWTGTFARLCLVYHLISVAAAPLRGFVPPDPYVVTGHTANRVRDYMRAVLAPMQIRADRLMFSTRMAGHANWIAGYILAHKLERITISNILAHYRPLRAPDHRITLDDVMNSLERVGWLEADSNPRNPHTPNTWRVNPLVHSRFAERAAAERQRRDETKARMDPTWVARHEERKAGA